MNKSDHKKELLEIGITAVIDVLMNAQNNLEAGETGEADFAISIAQEHLKLVRKTLTETIVSDLCEHC